VEKKTDGTEETKLYDTEAECKASRKKRDVAQSESPQPPSQNVRDPVREKAAQNYQAVLNELKDKFRGLKGERVFGGIRGKEKFFFRSCISNRTAPTYGNQGNKTKNR
jgi:hypothetical protein